jgi:hypothetical protein
VLKLAGNGTNALLLGSRPPLPGHVELHQERVEKLEPSDLEKVKVANYGHAPQFAGFDGAYFGRT